MKFKKMLINFRKKVTGHYSFVFEDKEEIDKYIQYKVSMPFCVARIANQIKVPKWLAFKNYMLESLNI